MARQDKAARYKDMPGNQSANTPEVKESELRHVTWDEWFETFDERGLNLIYQERRGDGAPSDFLRLENPQREDA